MFTAVQCLVKAMELEQQAVGACAPDLRAEFSDLALQWRRLACRALVQDQRAATAGTPQA